MSKDNLSCPKFIGASTLGERGQVVIPQEVRKSLNLKNGQKFVVMQHNQAVIFVPEKQVQKIFNHLSKILNK